MHSRARPRTRFRKYNRKNCVFMVRARARAIASICSTQLSEWWCVPCHGAMNATQRLLECAHWKYLVFKYKRRRQRHSVSRLAIVMEIHAVYGTSSDVISQHSPTARDGSTMVTTRSVRYGANGTVDWTVVRRVSHIHQVSPNLRRVLPHLFSSFYLILESCAKHKPFLLCCCCC